MNQNYISITSFDLGSHCSVINIPLPIYETKRRASWNFFHYAFCVQLRSSLLWDFMQYRFVITDVSGLPIGCILKGPGVQEEEDCWILEDGTVKCHETSVTNYQITLRKISEKRKSRIHRCGSLKSPVGGILVKVKLVCLLYIVFVNTSNDYGKLSCQISYRARPVTYNIRGANILVELSFVVCLKDYGGFGLSSINHLTQIP